MANVTGSLPPNGQHSPAPDEAGIAGSVTDQWAEVYPPDGAETGDAVNEPRLGDPQARLAGVATVLFGASVILVVAGSFLPLFQLDQPVGASFTNVTSTLSMDAWHITAGGTAPDNTALPARVDPAPVPLGFPLLATALLTALVVLLRVWMVRRPAGEPLAHALGIAAAAFTTGMVFAVGTFEMGWRALGSSPDLGPAETIIGNGYWLLVIAAVVAVIAAVMAYHAHRRRAETSDESAVFVDQASQQEPVVMSPDPLVPPGQPAEWPVVAVIPTDERTNW